MAQENGEGKTRADDTQLRVAMLQYNWSSRSEECCHSTDQHWPISFGMQSIVMIVMALSVFVLMVIDRGEERNR